jgi:hypothetical protein
MFPVYASLYIYLSLCIPLGRGDEHAPKKFMVLVGDARSQGGLCRLGIRYRRNQEEPPLNGVEANIPVSSRNGKKPKPYNIGIYRRMRSAIERFFGWIKDLVG